MHPVRPISEQHNSSPSTISSRSIGIERNHFPHFPAPPRSPTPPISNRNNEASNVIPPSDETDQNLDALRDFFPFDTTTQNLGHIGPSGHEDILKQMRTWIDNPKISEPIMWLHGPAGVGKSAIAQTILHIHTGDKLAARFFFARSDPRRNDGNRLFPTLALQLARSIPNCRRYIADSLKEDPLLPGKAIENQFERLIAQPLREMYISASQVPLSTDVVVIDGLDECTDESIQRKIIQILGQAVSGAHFPLRFIFLTRTERHIVEAFAQFYDMISRIDIGTIVDAYRDIEEYLSIEFARIAAEQELDSISWPDQEIIENIAFRSSGQFIYAATVVRFVGDEHSSAVSQLDIIMRINGESGLDALYLEILRQQPDQPFVKDFLAILVARKSISEFSDITGEDDALLLNTDNEGLNRRLRGMHSLLIMQLQSIIDIHHPSFLDFLQEPSRSGQYHISKQNGTRRYLERITDAVVRRVSLWIERPDFHATDHFDPEFGNLIHHSPGAMELSPQVWEEVLRPLVRIQGELVGMPNFQSLRRGYCGQCRFFQITDDLLLYLKSLQEAADDTSGSRHQQNIRLNFGLGFGLAAIVALHLARHS